ncbi:unnamed protein product [Linum trigynum]|uniref:Uncharacterized protein n=1 Tax=Linum trigynum TaxID=586398 RepID=A0AAV2DYP5_9ROSI
MDRVHTDSDVAEVVPRVPIVVTNVEFHRHRGGRTVAAGLVHDEPVPWGVVTRRSDVECQVVACSGTAFVVDGKGESSGEVGDDADIGVGRLHM